MELRIRRTQGHAAPKVWEKYSKLNLTKVTLSVYKIDGDIFEHTNSIRFFLSVEVAIDVSLCHFRSSTKDWSTKQAHRRPALMFYITMILVYYGDVELNEVLSSPS